MRQRAQSKQACSVKTPDELPQLLRDLPHWNRQALIQQWRDVHETEPPSGLSHIMLVRALAYKLQEAAQGGLSPHMRQRLRRIAEDHATSRASDSARHTPIKIKPGTRLLRTWYGMTHSVTVLENGVMWNDVPCRSLSEVAYRITGSKWSGPLFFGLKKGGRV